MSAIATPIEAVPSWKKEIHQRVTEHKSRKSTSPQDLQIPLLELEQSASSRRAREAAARVAARYAKAPSYSEVLASEARAVLRAAESATRAAQQAQMAAESVLAEIEAIRAPEPEPQPALRPGAERLDGMRIEPLDDFFTPSPTFSAPNPASAEFFPQSKAFEIRWEPDMPHLPATPPVMNEARGRDRSAVRFDEMGMVPLPEERGGEAIEIVEPAQPIHANLIEFPRELVAARKARPRLVEGFSEARAAGFQLSIFEVDPGSISTVPAAAEVVGQQANPWAEPMWPAIELEPEPELYREVAAAPADYAAVAAHAFELAPMHRRLLASLIDGSVVAIAVLSVIALGLSHSDVLPGVRTLEVGAVLGFAVAAILYQALFMTVAKSTPGMMYAHIRLATFEGQPPTRAQRMRRVGALLVSALPAGLGMGWAIFDEQNMAWHDRLSHTYPKMNPF